MSRKISLYLNDILKSCAYFQIEPGIVWDIIQTKIQPLQEAVLELTDL